MGKPVRVLHVLGGVSLGGAESRIMDLYRCMDRDKVQFDFLVHAITTEERTPEFYDEEIEKMGGNIYVLPKFKVYNYISYKKAVKDFFMKHNDYSVVQGHMTSTAAIYLPVAKKAGIPVSAAHARSAGVDKGIKGVITKWLRKPLMRRADYCFACSKEAGEAVFGKAFKESRKAYIFPNAIDEERFVYKEEIRKLIRKELAVEDCYVIGHTGRFHYAKNHEYLLEIFACFYERMKKQEKKTVLLLLGEGDGMKAVKELAKKRNIEDAVIFLGNKKDVEKYYQAMDFFVFPSRFEGLPGTVVEAQAAGLSCIISDKITKEVGVTLLVHYESIDKMPDIWAEYMEEHAFYERRDMEKEIKEAGFDVREQAVVMEKFYLTGII